MAERRQRRGRTTAPRASVSARTRILLLGGSGIAAIAVVVVFLQLRGSDPGSPVAWARLRTTDVHSLTFPTDSTRELLFGHHGGVLRSVDAGQSWSALPAGGDAMGMAAAPDGSIVIAGHNVFRASLDGGASWAPIDANLPSLDIHSFTRSLSDPSTMWAYLAIGGVYQSTDFGATWLEVYPDHIQQLTAIQRDGADVLLGVDLRGVVSSSDGGRSWTPVGTPPTAPVTSLGATLDGRTIVLGGSGGLFRSDDEGLTWEQVLRTKTVLAAAISSDAKTLVAVNVDTYFYRSDDGGDTWPGPA